MNKKTIGALMLSAALLVGGTASTFAYFTNSAKTDVVSFTTGNVKVVFDATQETQWQLVTSDGGVLNQQAKVSEGAMINVAPGDQLKKSFVLKNTGSLDAKVRLSLASADDTAKYGTLASVVDWKAYEINKDGTKVPVEITYTTAADKSFAILPASTDKVLSVEAVVKVDKLLGNGAPVGDSYSNFDKTFGFIVKAEATQWNNPNWTEDGK